MFCRVVFEENVHYPVISDGDFAVIPVCFLLSCHLYSSASAGCVFTGGLPVAAIPLTAALALLCAAWLQDMIHNSWSSAEREGIFFAGGSSSPTLNWQAASEPFPACSATAVSIRPLSESWNTFSWFLQKTAPLCNLNKPGLVFSRKRLRSSELKCWVYWAITMLEAPDECVQSL